MRKKAFIFVLMFAIIPCSCSKKNISDYTFNNVACSEEYILACGDAGLIAVTTDLFFTF